MTPDSEDEKQARIDDRIAKWLKSGYRRDDLFISGESVIYDGEASEIRIFKDFDKKESNDDDSGEGERSNCMRPPME